MPFTVSLLHKNRFFLSRGPTIIHLTTNESPVSKGILTNESGAAVCLEELVQPLVHHGLEVDEAEQDVGPLCLQGELLQLADHQVGVLLLLQLTVGPGGGGRGGDRRDADQAPHDLIADPLLQSQ